MNATIEDIYELAPMQQGMLFHSLYEQVGSTYVEQSVVDLSGPLDHDAFFDAWQAVVDRHPALRSAFHYKGMTNPVQVVYRTTPLPRDEVDLRGLPAADQDKQLAEDLRQERQHGLDLGSAPLIRFRLYRTGERSYRVAMRLSHLVVDGWSVGIMFADFMTAYRALVRGQEVKLSPTTPYRDYVAWWSDRTTVQETAFWQAHLDGYRPPVLRLGAPQGCVDEDQRHDWTELSLADVAEDLTAFSKRRRLTKHTVVQAAWTLVLARFLDIDDLAVGTTFAHRPAELPAAEGMVGCLLNTVPVRAKVDLSAPVLSWLAEIQDTITAARDHLGISLAEIQRLAGVEPATPLLDSLVEFQNVPLPDLALHEEGLELHGYQRDSRPHAAIGLIVLPGEQMPGRVVYDTERFDIQTIRLMLGALHDTVRAIVTEQAATLGEIPVIDPQLRQELQVAAPECEREQPPAGAVADEQARQLRDGLGQLMAGLLGVDHIDPADNLVEHGMHSLLGTTVMNRIADEFGVSLELRTIFERPTIAGLADAMVAAGSSPRAASRPGGVDLAADAVLDDDLHPGDLPVAEKPARHILLTGATGTVGVNLAARLLSETDAELHCLVRAKSSERGAERVRDELVAAGLWEERFAGRIHAVPGNLAKRRFGLDPDRFAELAARVDEIQHVAAVVNFLPPYRRVKPTNVDGCVEILRLATTGKVKPVHYVSSVAVLGEAESGERTYTEGDLGDEPPELPHGYAQSKWVAERLMTIARQRGVPVSVYRLGRMSGDSVTGRWKLGDVLSETIRCCICLGLVPDTGTQVDLTPVDYAAAAVAAISQSGPAATYHVTNPARFQFPALAAAMEQLGYPVRTVSLAEWLDALTELARSSPDGRYAMALEVLGPWVEDLEQGRSEPYYDVTRTREVLAETLDCPEVDERLLVTYLRHFADVGFIPPVAEPEVDGRGAA